MSEENQVYAKLLYILLTLWESEANEEVSRRYAGKALTLFKLLHPGVTVSDADHEQLYDILE